MKRKEKATMRIDRQLTRGGDVVKTRDNEKIGNKQRTKFREFIGGKKKRSAKQQRRKEIS